MKKVVLLNLFLLILTIRGLAQNGPAELWSYWAGGTKTESATFVLECSDGGSLLIGSTHSNDGMVSGNNGNYDAWILKRRIDGTAEWAKCIGGKDYDIAYQAVEVSDGYVIVGSKNNDAWAFKLGKSGNLIWQQTYPNNAGKSSALYAIVKNPDGSFWVGGTTSYGGNAILYHLNSVGGIINGLSFTIGNEIREIRHSSDGHLIVMGNYRPNEEGCFKGSEVPFYNDVWIAKLTTAYNIIWSRYYGGTTADYFIDGEITKSNEIYILGVTYCKGSITGPNNIGKDWPEDFAFTWLARINSVGTLTNVKIVSSHPFMLDFGANYNCVTVDCKGQPVIGGGYFNLLGQFPAIIKYQADLSDIIWTAETNGSTSTNRILTDLQFTSDASYLAAGYWDDGDIDYFIIKTEKDPDCAPTANKCQNITPVSCGQTYSGNTSGRASTFGIADLSSCHSSSNPFSAGDQLFEIYKPNGSGDLVITLFSTNIDHDIFLLSTCNPVQCLYKSTSSVAGNGNNIEIIRVNNAPAGYYYVLVDGPTASQVGPFKLTVNCGLLDCGNAKPIECKQTLFNETNQNGFNNVSLYCNPSRISDPGTGCTGKEKVYSFLLNSTQNVTISLTNIRDPNDDMELFLFKDCNEDACLATSTNASGQNEIINVNLSAGRYFVVVDGWKESEGNYDITVDWNCCSNPIEVYNCGFVSYKYTGNGNNLLYTFTSTRAIAPGKKWKVGNTEIQTAGSTAFQYNFPSPGEYLICFPYLNANNCLEYCCYKVWISNPFDCYDFDYTFNANTNNFSFILNVPGATNIIWQDDSSGGTIGGGPISNPVPSPPSGACVEKTITVSYHLNGRWYLCCRKIWICNPFTCFEFDYRFDSNTGGMIFQLNTPGATNITWKDDTDGGDIGGGPVSNPLPVPPNPGDCVEKIISVKYFANGRWYICCRKIWICNPFNCLEFDYRYDLSNSGMVFQLNAPGATNITWKDDTGGGDIGGGPVSNPLPVPPNPGDCVERIISVKYFANGRWYLCCRKVWICNPFNCSDISFKFNGTSNTYQFQLNQGDATQITWKDDTGGGDIGGGPVSNPVPPPNGGPCVEKVITARYYYNGRWYLCCKRFWLCDPRQCAVTISTAVEPTGLVKLSVSNTYKNVFWYDQKTGNLLGTTASIQINFPYGSSQEVCVQYEDNGRTYMCCKTLVVVGNDDISNNKFVTKVYPNPGRDYINVSIDCWTDQQVKISLFDLNGKELDSKSIANCGQSNIQFTTHNLKSGIYYIKTKSQYQNSVHKVEILH